MRDIENLRRLRREWYHRNREAEAEKQRVRKTSRAEKFKEYINHLKESTACQDCGNFYKAYVMDLDHRDPKQKSFSVSKHNGSKSWDTLLAEITKCDIVCANCHRERTYGGRSIE